jgi:hypothetical protein
MVGPWLDSVRRNHALEHATASILMARYGARRLAGRASGDGFFLMGDVTPEAIEESAQEALARLKNGEANLAVSPHCGTNLAMAGFLAAGAASMSLARGRGQFGNAFLGATMAVMLAQPLGRLVQRHLTTRADLEGVEVVGMRTKFGGLHKVLTRAGNEPALSSTARSSVVPPES